MPAVGRRAPRVTSAASRRARQQALRARRSTRKNTRQRIRRRAQRYAPDMSLPGDQVTAPPEQRRPHPAGEYAYVPTRGSFDGEPFDLAPAGNLPPARERGPPGIRPGQPRPGQTRPASQRDVPPVSATSVPRPRQGHAPQPGPGRRPSQVTGTAPALPRQQPGRSSGAPGRSRRDPARGYPPLPGDPGPRYPQPEFSAWNEPAGPAPRAGRPRNTCRSRRRPGPALVTRPRRRAWDMAAGSRSPNVPTTTWPSSPATTWPSSPLMTWPPGPPAPPTRRRWRSVSHRFPPPVPEPPNASQRPPSPTTAAAG